jgi:hypothetical protein
MQDTPAEFSKLVEERYAQLAAEERVRICTEMFDTARALVEASLPDDLGRELRRYQVCERFYGKLAARALGVPAGEGGMTKSEG